MEGAKNFGYVVKLRRSTYEACNIVLKFVKFQCEEDVSDNQQGESCTNLSLR